MDKKEVKLTSKELRTIEGGCHEPRKDGLESMGDNNGTESIIEKVLKTTVIIH